jgi:Spy/CpxP family protein refolding chaperone
MRHLRMWTLALAALIAWCVPIRAADEQPKLVPEEGAIELVLLRHKAVRDDLKLTHRETRKIHEFTEAQWNKALEAEKLADAKERDRRYHEMTKEDEKFLSEVLTPAQKKRLDQITLQVAGLLWIKRPEIISALKLTDEQREKAEQYRVESRKEIEEILHSTTERDRHAEVRKHRAAAKKRMLELLTDEQEAKYNELIGPPFLGELRFDEPPLVDEKSEK